jgi:hypothetical protein
LIAYASKREQPLSAGDDGLSSSPHVPGLVSALCRVGPPVGPLGRFSTAGEATFVLIQTPPPGRRLRDSARPVRCAETDCDERAAALCVAKFATAARPQAGLRAALVARWPLPSTGTPTHRVSSRVCTCPLHSVPPLRVLVHCRGQTLPSAASAVHLVAHARRRVRWPPARRHPGCAARGDLCMTAPVAAFGRLPTDRESAVSTRLWRMTAGPPSRQIAPAVGGAESMLRGGGKSKGKIKGAGRGADERRRVAASNGPSVRAAQKCQ